MIKIYEYLSKTDFIDRFSGLENTAWADEWQALGVLFDWLVGSDDESHRNTNIRDWLGFQVMEMTAEEIEDIYSPMFKDFSSAENLLIYYSIIYGTYEHDGITYYLFDVEF